MFIFTVTKDSVLLSIFCTSQNPVQLLYTLHLNFKYRSEVTPRPTSLPRAKCLKPAIHGVAQPIRFPLLEKGATTIYGCEIIWVRWKATGTLGIILKGGSLSSGSRGHPVSFQGAWGSGLDYAGPSAQRRSMCRHPTHCPCTPMATVRLALNIWCLQTAGTC